MSVNAKRIVTAAVALLVLAWAGPSGAQTVRDGDDERPPYSRWSWGVLSGPLEVERRGVTIGTEVGVRLRKGLHLVVESGWMSDVVTGRRIDEVDGYMAYVRQAYNVEVSGGIDGRAWFGLAGFKVMPDGGPRGESSGVRPYAQATVGLVRVEYKPGFVIDGEPTSGAGLVLYGVTLGRDLLGTTNRIAYSGGAGVVFGDAWYLDLGLRFTRVHTTDHPTTIKRLVIGMGRRF